MQLNTGGNVESAHVIDNRNKKRFAAFVCAYEIIKLYIIFPSFFFVWRNEQFCSVFIYTFQPRKTIGLNENIFAAHILLQYLII